jgi:hypothetical protein
MAFHGKTPWENPGFSMQLRPLQLIAIASSVERSWRKSHGIPRWHFGDGGEIYLNLSYSVLQACTELYHLNLSESIWFIGDAEQTKHGHRFMIFTMAPLRTFVPHLVKFTKIVWFSWFSHHDSLGIPPVYNNRRMTVPLWKHLPQVPFGYDEHGSPK